jgi:hypothetical protein
MFDSLPRCKLKLMMFVVERFSAGLKLLVNRQARAKALYYKPRCNPGRAYV